jgi:molybdenum cofactor cytidylyltransferase
MGPKNVACVVLAAGSSRRFGANKLLHLTRGISLLERAIRACSGFPTIIVASTETAAHVDAGRTEVVINDEPDLGMSYSLQRANERVKTSHSIVVLPADLAMIESSHVASIAAVADADVTYPKRADGTPGHPVIFSPRARALIAQLPAGDTIRTLRDRSDLSRHIVCVEEPWPYLDIDLPSDEEFVRRNR